MADGFDIVSYLMGKQAGGEPPGPTPGGYGYTKLAEQDFTVITSSTTQTDVGTIACGSEALTSDKMLYVRIRDKAGKRPGYFLGVDQLYVNVNPANHTVGSTAPLTSSLGYDSNGTFKSGTTRNGVFSNQLSSNGKLPITAKYNSIYGAIDGTYHVEVYLLDWPDGVSPFATS